MYHTVIYAVQSVVFDGYVLYMYLFLNYNKKYFKYAEVLIVNVIVCGSAGGQFLFG